VLLTNIFAEISLFIIGGDHGLDAADAGGTGFFFDNLETAQFGNVFNVRAGADFPGEGFFGLA
jgi:hypothetical protein